MQHLQRHCLELWTRCGPLGPAARTTLGGMPLRDHQTLATPMGHWSSSSAPAAGSGQPAGALLPVPHPSIAAMRAISVGAALGSALLRAGARGTPSGRDKGGGLVEGPADVVGALGPAIGATCQAPLCGAGIGGGGPPHAARLPHAEPAGSARAGTGHAARGGESPPPPPPSLAGARLGAGGGMPDTGGEPKWFKVDGTGRAEPPPLPAPGGNAAPWD